VSGTFLYCDRTVESTLLVTLVNLVTAQIKATTNPLTQIHQILADTSTHTEDTIRYSASSVNITINSDASYISKSQAQSRAGIIFYLSSPHQHDTPVPTHQATNIISVILKHIIASAAEAELAALLQCARCLQPPNHLEELGHPKPPTAIHTDNECANSFAIATVKQHRSKAMDVRFYFIRYCIKQLQFILNWEPGTSNQAVYFTRQFSAVHHTPLRYTYTKDNASNL
jgi:hypothetical protein